MRQPPMLLVEECRKRRRRTNWWNRASVFFSPPVSLALLNRAVLAAFCDWMTRPAITAERAIMGTGRYDALLDRNKEVQEERWQESLLFLTMDSQTENIASYSHFQTENIQIFWKFSIIRISISFWIFIEDFAYYFTTIRTFLVG